MDTRPLSVRWLTVVALGGAVLAGCGARSQLRGPRDDAAAPSDGSRPDLGRDAGRDGGPDAGPMPEVSADCGNPQRYTTLRRTVNVEATARSTRPIVAQSWALVAKPMGATAALTPVDQPRTTITPDAVGDYDLRFTVRDDGGRAASCDVRVSAVVGPPVAICPRSELVVAQNTPLVVPFSGFDDDGTITYAYEILTQPAGAMASLVPVGVDGPATFTSATGGLYTLRLTVTDRDGARNQCTAMVRVTQPPVVRCQAEVSAPTRRAVTLMASASDDRTIVARAWTVETRPARSTSEPTPADQDTTQFTPDRKGGYVLRYTATDDDGLSATCMVRLTGTPTPPEAICPETVDTIPLSSAEVVAMAIDDGTIVSYAWTQVSRPPGSQSPAPTPANTDRTRQQCDIAGEYLLRLVVTDDDGQTGTCQTRVRAIPPEGLRVEMFWRSSASTSDVDLHMLSPTATRWTNDDDCYYANCQNGAQREWGAPGPIDNPRLDIDDTNGDGPENINIDRPAAGTYRVGVHMYGGQPSTVSASVSVNIYCGVGATTPIARFGPTTIAARNGDNDFWRVADVVVGPGGCSVTDLAVGGRPNITPKSNADRQR